MRNVSSSDDDLPEFVQSSPFILSGIDAEKVKSNLERFRDEITTDDDHFLPFPLKKGLGFIFRCSRELNDLEVLRNLHFTLVISSMVVLFGFPSTSVIWITERTQFFLNTYVSILQTYPERGADPSLTVCHLLHSPRGCWWATSTHFIHCLKYVLQFCRWPLGLYLFVVCQYLVQSCWCVHQYIAWWTQNKHIHLVADFFFIFCLEIDAVFFG